MKTTRSIATASVILLAICHAYGVSFTYSYSDVFQSSAEDFLVSQSNVQKVNEESFTTTVQSLPARQRH